MSEGREVTYLNTPQDCHRQDGESLIKILKVCSISCMHSQLSIVLKACLLFQKSKFFFESTLVSAQSMRMFYV